RKLQHEHILIHFCETPRKQVWQWVTAVGDGKRVLHREHPFFSHDPPPRLLERLADLAIPIEMEEGTTLLDVLDRVRAALFADSELNLFVKKPWYAKRSDQLAMDLKAGKPGAFGKFVEFHLPLARKSSRKLIRWFGMDADDAEQTAMIGLLQAARRFDPERGYQFSTYASYWIRQSCQRYGIEWGLPIRVPIHLFWPCYRMTFVRAELVAKHGECDAESRFNDELEVVGLTREQWDDFCHARQVGCFTDVDTCDRRQLTLVDDDADNADYAIDHEMELALHRAIESLNPRQAFILKMRYGFGGQPHSLQETANELGITRERVRQIQARAEEKLERRLRMNGFAPPPETHPVEASENTDCNEVTS
ncbi:MAG: sigma-70 family RNA polymerase sigma factor, partial [Planctomycetia bacterium]|nr:sigma-70 family RNA polymerase sigma factor [Planctomycetia bacterium]